MFTLRNVGKIENLEKEILSTIHYFFFFDYPPNFEEIYTFLKKKLSKRGLASILENMVKKKMIDLLPSLNRYTLGEYSKQVKSKKVKVKNWIVREEHSRKKIQKIQLFLKILSLFPQIRLIGLSGTVAMMNAEEKDDIDLFIITAKNRLFTARIITLLLAQIMGIRRKRLTYSRRPSRIGYKDKICLNLFFDASDLKVPKFKQTEYVAHEVLQMKPLINKGDTYVKFIDVNRWVFDIFPNSSSKFKVQSSKLQFKIQNFKLLTSIFNYSFLTFNFVADTIEKVLKRFQLFFIRSHQTTEIITDTQLWFFPDDFEKRISKTS